MSGAYTTQTRSFQVPRFPVKVGEVGSAGETQYIGYPTVAPSQSTYSWRTKRQVGGVDEISEDDLRTTRNGFTTNDPKTDTGHEFWTTKTSFDHSVTPDVYAVGNYGRYGKYFFRGPLIPKVEDPYGRVFPSVSRTASHEAADLGQRAVLLAAPTSPQASLAVTIGETMNDGLPALVGSGFSKSETFKDFTRNSAGEYLNVQFGILPLVNDLKKLAKSLQGAHKTLAQLRRDNGRVIRRRIAFPPEVTSRESYFSTYNGPYVGSYLDNYFLAAPMEPVHKLERTERSVWFSGAVSYAMPTDDNLWSKLERYDTMANVLLGSRLTPETLWELAPWSWLADWKLGIGQMLASATRYSEDGLVLRYGYLMIKTIRTTSYMVNTSHLREGGTIPACSLNLRSEVKERIRATPFGFGLDSASFTSRQKSILAALGMSRLR